MESKVLAVDFLQLRRPACSTSAAAAHNSFHASERACVTSQFEQLNTSRVRTSRSASERGAPAAIVNLFGDLWRGDSA